MSKVVFSLLVDDEAGVMGRIVGLFSRRSYSLESVTAGGTEVPGVSRVTVVAEGEPDVLEQIEKQLAKLVNVKEIKALEEDASVCRELILMKVAVDAVNRPQVIAIAEIFRAKVVDVAVHSMMLELTGTQSKIDAFTNLLGEFKIIEMARTGITGLSRGMK